MPSRCRATQRLERWGVSSPTRSRRACLKTWRIGKSVNNPMASTTQKTTSWVNLQARGLIRPVAAKGLANGLGWDNLFESRQSVQNPARFIGRQRALSLWHASHSLLVAWVLSKPKGNKRL